VTNEKRKHATFTLPAWLLDDVDAKARDEFRSKSQMVEEALIKHFGFERGE
jgi:metal-responsive CopG/Arc/MetJ family transcriptional regulator